MKKILLSVLLLFLINSLFLLAIVSDSIPVENTWNIKKSLPNCSRANPVVLNGKIYVISNTQNTRYDPKGDTWKTLPPMPTPRYANVVVYQDKIYCIGDAYPSGKVSYVNVVEVYDPSNNNWSKKASIPNNVGSLQAYVANEQLFVITYNGDMYLYDPLWDSWSSRAALPVNAACETSCVVNEQLFVTAISRENPRELYRYNPSTDSWIKRAQPPQFRLMLAVIDNKIIAISYGGNEDQLGVHIYDSKTNVWREGKAAPKQGFFDGELISVVGVTSGVYTPKQVYVFGYANLQSQLAQNGFIDENFPVFTWVYDIENNDWLTAETLQMQGQIFDPFSEKLVVIDDIFYLMGTNGSYDPSSEIELVTL